MGVDRADDVRSQVQSCRSYLQPVRVRLFGEGEDEALRLPPFLHDAYRTAERVYELLGQRAGLNSGFLKTVLLRRVGSTVYAGERTARKLLRQESPGDEEDDDALEESTGRSSFLYPLTSEERAELERFLAILRANRDEDPKGCGVERILLADTDDTGPWLEQGCLVFTQYYDSALWIAQRLSESLSDDTAALYADAHRSGVMRRGSLIRLGRDTIKAMVQSGEVIS